MATSATAAQTSRRIFISYSRKDASVTAHHLRDILLAAGYQVWLDTDRILGGASWSREIEAALNNCDVLVALLTEGSFISEICRAEQMWALREDKRVIPVLATPNAPRPLYLSTLNYRRFPGQERDLLADLDSQPTSSAPVVVVPPRYDTIPPLPQTFLAREKDVAGLRNLVFTEGQDTSIAVTAVAGMGGIGKTVLAAALCRDIAVQRAFPDGIAWITIGREWDGDFVPRMREVAKALGDDLSGYDNPLACQNRYRNILREKAALVVVDDVWNIEHLKLLLVDAPRSRFLFTTRDGGIAKNITNRKYSANLLDEDQARDLLAHSSGKKVTELPPEADEIIRACDGLPAAVSQIGASLRDLSLAEWRDTLEALGKADISAIEEQLPPGQQSFFKSLAVSIQAIPPQMQERYLKLSVVLEDMPAPLAVLQTLWAVNEAEARRTARYLVDRSLATWEAATDPSRGITLHDLQLDYVRARHPERQSLDLILGAIRLSTNVILIDPREFASQVTGRLLPHCNAPGIQTFLDEVAGGASKPWLRPLRPALHPPGAGLLRTLEGHSGFVYAVAVTGDGKRAVSASEDSTLTVWDLENGRTLRVLKGHSAAVYAVVVTPDGKLAVSASEDQTLKIWGLESGQTLRTLEGRVVVFGLAAASDGKRAVAACRDGTVKVWDLESGRVHRTLEGHANPVHAVALTADGKRAVSASSDSTLSVWDLETGRVLHTLKRHSDFVYAVAVTADGKRAVSASKDNTLIVWDLQSGRMLRKLRGHSASVNAVAVLPDGRQALSASSDNTLKLWDLESGRSLFTWDGHSDTVNCLAITADGKKAISGADDNTLKLWDLGRERALRMPEDHSSSITGVAASADGRRVISTSIDGTLKLWDLETGCSLSTLEDQASFINALALSADGKRAVCASDDGTLTVWDLESVGAVRALGAQAESVNAVAVTADSKRAVSGSADNTLTVWDLESVRAMRTLEGHSDSVNAVAVTADGKRAISASDDQALKLWDLESGRVLRTLRGHSAFVTGVAVDADGKRAISASDDQTLKLWDLESGRVQCTLEGHSDFISGVAMTMDGRRAVSASYDRTLNAWDLESGRRIATFHCDAGVSCCAFARQNIIVAGDDTGRVHFLRLEE